MICWKNMLKLDQNPAAQSLELVKEVLKNVALRILCPHEIFQPMRCLSSSSEFSL